MRFLTLTLFFVQKYPNTGYAVEYETLVAFSLQPLSFWSFGIFWPKIFEQKKIQINFCII